MLHPNEKRTLAIDLRSRSFGFVVFEGQTRLLEWGVKSLRRGVNAAKIPAAEKVSGLMDEFSPSAIVLKKWVMDNRKRIGMRKVLLEQAEKRRIPVRLLSRRVVKNAFVGSNRNKHMMATAVMERLPVLASRLPDVRKIWKG